MKKTNAVLALKAAKFRVAILHLCPWSHINYCLFKDLQRTLTDNATWQPWTAQAFYAALQSYLYIFIVLSTFTNTRLDYQPRLHWANALSMAANLNWMTISISWKAVVRNIHSTCYGMPALTWKSRNHWFSRIVCIIDLKPYMYSDARF